MSKNLKKEDFPLHMITKTLSMREIQRYDKFNMSSALISANIERSVQRELAGRKDFPMKLFFSFIGLCIMFVGLGLMVYMIMQGIGQMPVEETRTIVAALPLLILRCKHGRKA